MGWTRRKGKGGRRAWVNNNVPNSIDLQVPSEAPGTKIRSRQLRIYKDAWWVHQGSGVHVVLAFVSVVLG